jgi:hypothetical protein
MLGWMSLKTKHKGLNDYRTDHSSQQLGLNPAAGGADSYREASEPIGHHLG